MDEDQLRNVAIETFPEVTPAPNWQANVIVDERQVTGQNPASKEGEWQSCCKAEIEF